MLTLVQRNALDRFVKSLATLGDDSLIDAYHQAWEDHRDARAEGSDMPDMEPTHAGVAIVFIEHSTPSKSPFAKPIDLATFAVTQCLFGRAEP